MQIKGYFSKKRDEWRADGCLNGILRCIAGLSFIGIVLCILLYTRYAYNSDFSYATNLALEELKQHKLYPAGWCYSTGFYVFSINLLCIPFLLFLKNEVLCRELAMILLCVIMLYACYITLRKYSKRMFWTVVVLIFLPIGGVVHWYFYDGNYFNFAVMQMIVLFLAGKLLFDEKIKHIWFWYILYIGALVIFTNDGLRNQLYIAIPMFLTVFFFSYRRTEGKLFEKKYLLFLGATTAGAGLGYGVYRFCLMKTGWWTTDSTYTFVNPTGAIGNLWTFLANVFKLYGVCESDMLTVQGIINVVNGLYAIVAMFVIPILVLKNFKKIQSEYVRFLMLFCAFCNGLSFYMLIMTNNSGERLLLPMYFNNILFAGCFMGYLADSVCRRYEEILVLAVVALACVNLAGYQMAQQQDGKLQNSNGVIEALFVPTDESGLVDFLKEQGMDYGYAPYFHAFRTASFSEGELRIVSFENNNPMAASSWMTSSLWYNVEEHSGKCFILLPEGIGIEQKYYELADEILEYTADYAACANSEVTFFDEKVNYTILVYEKNIHLYDELAATE